MFTDAPPRRRDQKQQFDASDKSLTIALPAAEPLVARSTELRDALAAGEPPSVREVGQRMLDELSQFYGIAPPKLTEVVQPPIETVPGKASNDAREKIRRTSSPSCTPLPG